MNEVRDYLKNSGMFFIATIDEDKPRVRPFGVAEIYDNRLYIQTGKRKDVFKQIMNNSNVEICAFNNGTWIRIEGNLILDDRVEVKKYLLDQNPELRNMYNENDDNTAALYFEKGRATIYSFTSEPKVIEF
ncbi:MAG: pyridoxamine 5'-phosphate oxidase family protein [Bacilli bacterium]|nr:pyridoxamine 5'-phosphate oxidase family protein [Bacilli bacterium]